jgi:microcystin-dependent protein
MPSHTHTIADHAHGTDGGSTHFLTKASGVGSYDAAAGTTYQHQSATGTTSLSPASTGGGGAHNNLHPHFVLHFIIKT